MRLHTRLFACTLVALLGARSAHAASAVDCPDFWLCVGTGNGSGLSYVQPDANGQTVGMAFGFGSQSQNDGLAIGNSALATGSFSSAIGVGANATGDQSMAWGYFSNASASHSLALGYQANATGADAIAIGGNAAGQGSIAVGNVVTYGVNSVGINGGTYSDGSIAIGGSAGSASDPVNSAFATTIGTQSQALGPQSLALGYQAQALASQSVALGSGTIADQANTVAVGNRRIVQVAPGTANTDAVNLQQLNTAIAGVSAGSGGTPIWIATSNPVAANATGNASTAIGGGSSTAADSSSAFGVNASVTSGGQNSVALGATTTTDRANTVAIGGRTLSQLGAGVMSDDAVTVGQVGPMASSLGGGANFNGGVFTAPTYALSGGIFNNVGSALSSIDTNQVAGFQAQASYLGGGASYLNGTFVGPSFVLSAPGAAGTYTTVNDGLQALDHGLSSVNTRIDNLALGTAPAWLATDAPQTAASQAGFDEVAVGPGAAAGQAANGQNTAVGAGASAGATGPGTGQATAVGAHADAVAVGSSALGQSAQVTQNGVFSVAIGAQTTTDRADTVALGGRTLSQVGFGSLSDDGVAVGQLYDFAAAYGGGASFQGGVFVAPTYSLSGSTFNNVGDALTFLDNRIDGIGTGPGTPGPVGPTGPTGPQGPKGDPGTGNGTDSMAVHYDSAAKTSVTLGGADANGVAVTPAVTLSNVANGAVNATSTEAVNGAQLYQVQQASTAYTDQQVSNVQNWAKTYTDNKFAQARRDSDQAGAAGGAIGMMALSASRVSPDYRSQGNLSMATGVYGHAGAIAMGWSQTYDKGRVGVAVAASWTGDHTFVGGSVSIGLDDLW